METQIRDRNFAHYVNELAETINVPQMDLALSAWELAVGTVVTVVQAFATPEPGTVQQALRGVAV